MIPAVGILSALTMRKSQTDLQAAMSVASGAVTDPSTLPIASPWSDSTLERIVFSDIFGADYGAGIHTRAGAMRVPAIARGRNLMCSTIGRFPLRAARRGVALETQPGWLSNSDDGTSPQHKLVWTVDDLIFYGWSCWARTNGSDGFPLSTRRVNQGDWTVNDDNRVEINGIPQNDTDVILIPGFHEGILSFGRDALTDARTLREIVADRLANPVPQTELHQTGGKALNKTERDELVEHWRAARRAAGGGVGYTNEHIELKTHGADADASLMIEARNAAALDLARVIGVSAGMLDATAPKASLNYETQTGRNQEFVDFDLALYMTPITARLSLDDVTPHGTHVVFDLTDYTAPAPSPTGPALED